MISPINFRVAFEYQFWIIAVFNEVLAEANELSVSSSCVCGCIHGYIYMAHSGEQSGHKQCMNVGGSVGR